jgi:hypothetical protein
MAVVEETKETAGTLKVEKRISAYFSLFPEEPTAESQKSNGWSVVGM